MILKVFVNTRQIDEIHIHNAVNFKGDLRGYIIRKPDLNHPLLLHHRRDGWRKLVVKALRMLEEQDVGGIIMYKKLRVFLSNGECYDVPVDIIAKNRALHFAHEFDDSISRSLKEDTIPLFEGNSMEILDWASNNMDWSDIKTHAVRVDTPDFDYEEAWMSADLELLDD